VQALLSQKFLAQLRAPRLCASVERLEAFLVGGRPFAGTAVVEHGERIVRVEKLRLEKQAASIYLTCLIRGLVKTAGRPAAKPSGAPAAAAGGELAADAFVGPLPPGTDAGEPAGDAAPDAAPGAGAETRADGGPGQGAAGEPPSDA